MNRPTPAIVAQSAVRRLPRWALVLFCTAYVLAGFVGRGPWKNADISAFGYMLELAQGRTDWLQPVLGGLPPETEGLLAYWLGAWALRIAPSWVSSDLAARVPFGLLLVLTLAATWYAVYSLARSPRAQPVAFAFGGEAQPRDYARAIADGGLLALIACLGLAQLSHEGTAYLTQLAFTTLAFFALAVAPYRMRLATASLVTGLAGLSLSGAPTLALLFGTGGALLAAAESRQDLESAPILRRWAMLAAAVTLAVAALAAGLHLWHWRIDPPTGGEWRSVGRLLLWFTWPAWPLVLWTLWRWRRQLASRELHRHLLLPAGFAAVAVLATLTTTPADRALLLALPALATLAAFALPTLGRSVAALVDWFTLLFFTGAAVIVWIIYIAMHTGWPRQPAANVAKLAPGFVAEFSPWLLAIALAATLAWGLLVRWRVGRQQHALWKSVVLPAGGAGLAWLLLMTLWLPLLDYARSYAPQVQRVVAAMDGPTPSCVEFTGFSRAQVAAFQYHGGLRLQPARREPACSWLLVDVGAPGPALEAQADPAAWTLVATVARPADRKDTVQLYRARPAASARPAGR
ncbi:hypothetical protein [uncultured Xylophilus sp.]|uniref:hypothetical protein n=1 Tax=uncultured Xylophilus sp. TaxID=296832 RepID=UPI0025DED7A3|nr:hypothetical protein [uncultured Xylophilus sp.]